MMLRKGNTNGNNGNTTLTTSGPQLRTCLTCGSSVPIESRFCNHCGSQPHHQVHNMVNHNGGNGNGAAPAQQSSVRCEQCHAFNADTARFCLSCGHSLVMVSPHAVQLRSQ
jgi:rRNA maturation endonuclease Nob1